MIYSANRFCFVRRSNLKPATFEVKNEKPFAASVKDSQTNDEKERKSKKDTNNLASFESSINKNIFKD